MIDRDYSTTRCNRAKLDTGTFCNYDCEFCYYQGLLNIKTDVSEILDRIDYIHKYGIDEIDLSGGESSVHKNWFDILSYCSSRFKNISTLSNGWAFADEEFMIKSKDHGLKEILFSVHGVDEQNHDEIVRRKGAWSRINKAIANAHKHGIVVRINCTIYQKNYMRLNEYIDVIKRLNPLELNFITLNYWTNNKHAEPIDYKAATDHIKLCINDLKDHVKYINVRYTPYCYMKGYEKYVCNHAQHIYDRYDWNKEMYNQSVDVSKSYTEKEKIDFAYDQVADIRSRDYYKPSECITCKYFNICDGPEKQVKSFTPLPEPGDKIQNVNHYRHGFYDS